MPSAISADDLRRETDATITDRIAHICADGGTTRDAVAALAVAGLDAAEDAAYWLRIWLADGWAGVPDQIPTTAPSRVDRDRMLLAGMTAARNAVTLAGAVRIRQDVDRPSGWDPLRRPQHH